jgi:biotin carboxylase
VIDDPARAVEAARGLEFPVLVKPNVGGSGAGISSYSSLDELADARVELGKRPGSTSAASSTS